MHPGIATYHARFDGDVRLRLNEIHERIGAWLPESEQDIRYAMPTFRLGGRNRVHYAAYARHIGLYPGPAALQALAPRLSDWTHSKGAIQFPHDRPLPWSLIEALVRWEGVE